MVVADLAREDTIEAEHRAVTGVTPITEARRLVESGQVAAALILRGIPKSAIAEVAEAGETMPQKSTYFFPKLLTGVAFHSLVDG